MTHDKLYAIVSGAPESESGLLFIDLLGFESLALNLAGWLKSSQRVSVFVFGSADESRTVTLRCGMHGQLAVQLGSHGGPELWRGSVRSMVEHAELFMSV